MPIVFVYWREGRSQKARGKAANALAEALASVPETMVKKGDVEIWFFDIPVGYHYSGGQHPPVTKPNVKSS